MVDEYAVTSLLQNATAECGSGFQPVGFQPVKTLAESQYHTF